MFCPDADLALYVLVAKIALESIVCVFVLDHMSRVNKETWKCLWADSLH